MYIKPKKSLGQNFLIDKNIQNKIVRASGIKHDDLVLEIGSGRGDLTAQLVLVAKKVYALEIDERLYALLDERLAPHENYQILKNDILKFDLNNFLQKEKIHRKIKVIGNIPYYISSPIIEQLINYRRNIEVAFITVQKEFGRRMVARPGSKEFGAFSCFVQYYLEPKILFLIKKNSFQPVPKIDSCFLSLRMRANPAVKVRVEVYFFKIIRAAFGQRRKTLRNSLDNLVRKECLEGFFIQEKVSPNVRPEDLSLEQFAALANLL